MEERVFFEQGNIRVTSARFIVGSRTYAMNGVTSVKAHVEPPRRGGAIIAICVGAFLIMALPGSAKVVGILIVGAAIWYLTQQRPIHAVVLSSSSGEAQALSDEHDKNIDIEAVVGALNDSIIHRG